MDRRASVYVGYTDPGWRRRTSGASGTAFLPSGHRQRSGALCCGSGHDTKILRSAKRHLWRLLWADARGKGDPSGTVVAVGHLEFPAATTSTSPVSTAEDETIRGGGSCGRT